MPRIFVSAIVFLFCPLALFAVDTASVLSSSDLTVINRTEGGASNFETINKIAESYKQSYSARYPYLKEIDLNDEQVQKELTESEAGTQYVVTAKRNNFYNAILLTVITQSEHKLYIYTKYQLDDNKTAPPPLPPQPQPQPEAPQVESDEEVANTFAEIDELNKGEGPLEIISKTTSEDGSSSVSYKVSDSVTRTVYTDAAGNKKLIEEDITVPESFNETVAKYTKIFTEKVPYFRGGFEASAKLDARSLPSSKDTGTYKGIITIKGSRMNGIEYHYKQKLVTQRYWWKKKYYDKVIKTLGPDIGFIAFFDNIQGVHVADDEDNGAVQTYEFNR